MVEKSGLFGDCLKVGLRLFIPFGVLACGSAPDGTGVESQKKPNIIYIMADDLGYGDLSSYGQQRFQTPNIDRLAAEGMRFTDHYSGSTVCAPSRSSLMTGLHTGHTPIRGNKEFQPIGQEPLPAESVTVAEVLKQAGYKTGIVGKWGLGPPQSSGEPNSQGFDYWFGYLCQRNAHRYYPPYLWRNREQVTLEGNQGGGRGQYSHDLMTEEALTFIRKNKDEPFFLYVPYTIPHADLDVPEDSSTSFSGRFDLEPYAEDYYQEQKDPGGAFAGMISRLDRDVGRIIDELDRLGLSEDTVVLFTSDNGPHQEGGATPGYFGSSGPFRGIKRDLYEGGIRVPFLARWPGKIEPGSMSSHVSAFWDFLPTAAEIAGVEVTSEIDGVSYLPSLLGESSVQSSHEYLYWEFHEQGGKQAVRLGDWKGVRLNVGENPDGPIELYYLSSDPGEQQDVAAEHPDVVEEIRRLMRQARTESPLWSFKG
jgi:arylsulfatase A-like enzyme